MGAYAAESFTAFDAPDDTIGHEINTILTHRTDALHSFTPPDDLLPDPTDLQSSYIHHLQTQREELLRALRVESSQEILTDPERFFRTIVSEFQDICRQRLVWGRAHITSIVDERGANILQKFESAHTASFVRKPGGLQPSLWVSIGYHNDQPITFRATTHLHNEQSWAYVFSSAPNGGFSVAREGYERGRTCLYPIENPIDKASLLQALGVEMLDSVTAMQCGQQATQAVRHEAAMRRIHEIVHRQTL